MKLELSVTQLQAYFTWLKVRFRDQRALTTLLQDATRVVCAATVQSSLVSFPRGWEEDSSQRRQPCLSKEAAMNIHLGKPGGSLGSGEARGDTV
jgi:hypothetical protein